MVLRPHLRVLGDGAGRVPHGGRLPPGACEALGRGAGTDLGQGNRAHPLRRAVRGLGDRGRAPDPDRHPACRGGHGGDAGTAGRAGAGHGKGHDDRHRVL